MHAASEQQVPEPTAQLVGCSSLCNNATDTVNVWSSPFKSQLESSHYLWSAAQGPYTSRLSFDQLNHDQIVCAFIRLLNVSQSDF